jgi:DNA-binding HxlR family transcriptional regulator
MAKRKELSTNNINRINITFDCDLMHAVFLLGGRWKLLIIGRLENKKLRFSELSEQMPAVSDRMLTLQLRELEKDGLISRSVFAEVPPRVEYELTEIGKALIPVCRQLQDWGTMHKRSLEG